ncbi:nitroreductase family deazaflavin-dependent oxidoreductase [Actinomadura geliboluensis]|uniref:nitroreductase family deazaflavin-dependent oxidoreductase n=1 Tax=Actinomadura geliboluensis TaxID=882440 RepID=UPI0036788DB6
MTAPEDEILDSPTPWVADHIRAYLDTGGVEGHLFMGWPTLLLTTRGRRSGRLRRTALIYGRDQDRYLLVASNGGADHHPAWYLNLTDTPTVSLQVGPDHLSATARTATAEEKPRLWQIMAELFPQYAKYQEESARELPLVILTPQVPHGNG